MGRKPRKIEGVVSDVKAVESHKKQFRIRFKLNGVATESYRSTKEAANLLHNELSLKAQIPGHDQRAALTTLSPKQVRQAEMAFQVLDNAQLIDLKSDDRAEFIVDAANLLVTKVRNQVAGIRLGDAFSMFFEKQSMRLISPKTLYDYRRFLEPFIKQLENKLVSEVEPMECKRFIEGQGSEVVKFKAHTCIAAFFNFCTGKDNHYVNPAKELPWIRTSPINFPKAAPKLGDIHSYDFAETKTLIKAASTNNQLGYVIFRLFSMTRFEETARFISLASSDFTENPYIRINDNSIHFNAEVCKGGNGRGRIVPINPTFKAWIMYFVAHKIRFSYNEPNEIKTRRAVGAKFGKGFTNLIRHSAVTFHVKAFNDIAATAKLAGNSVRVIMSNYYNSEISKADACAFYEYTPDRAVADGLIKQP